MAIVQEREIFLDALEIESPADRRAFLVEACHGDEQLLNALMKLLEAHDRAQNPLDQPIAGAPSRGLDVTQAPSVSHFDHISGGMVGPYKLREQIGEGGFGLVFVADQEQPVRRRVALKIIKPGMESREVLARFEAERQALALMDHPNIARVFDAGVTPTGQPYFVMELVRGVPLCEFCDHQKLNTQERLQLFISICHAVQHAHQKGVIHRDLKPSNVLVTLLDGRPLAKVIDFGVAKAIGQSLTGKTIYTRFASMIGTPAYMSPEQAEMSATDVDTRSDIYSLGVLLYELLTGSTPFAHDRLNSAGFDELRRIIREEEPPRPSTRLHTLSNEIASTVSLNRRSEPARLSSVVRGDLDWIVMKAIDKDRNRRYPTAGALAEDVTRYLTEQPIDARPPSITYRFRKFARRNKVALTTASIVLAALVLGTIVSVWQAREAIVARNELEQFNDRLKQANVLLQSGRTHADSGRWAAADADYTAATETQPMYYHVWIERGSMYVKLGLWKQAAADFAKALELGAPVDGVEWWGVPQLFWLADDKDDYRKLCQTLVDVDDNRQHAESAIRGLLMGGFDGMKASTLVERAESLLAFGHDNSGRRFEPGHHRGGPPPPDNRREPWPFGGPGMPFGAALYTAGWAHYRAGNYELAIERLEQSEDDRWMGRGICTPLLAMSYHQLGKNEEANRAIEEAQELLDLWLDEAISSQRSAPIPWFDWIEFLVNYRDAYQLVKGKAPAEDPRLEQLQQQAMGAIE